MRERYSRGQSPIIVTAGLAGAILLAAIGWQLGGYRSEHVSVEDPLQFDRQPEKEIASTAMKGHSNWREELALLGIISGATDEAATTTPVLDGLGNTIAQEFLNGYLALKQSGLYTPERGAALGRNLGVNIRAPSGFVLHGESELTLDPDTSLTRVLKYRSDMREALAVLVNREPPEFETFARYVETKNPERLNELQEAADRYRVAEQGALSVVVPQDAAALHLRAVNSLGSFGITLDTLIQSAERPFESLVVLRTYNEAEREMLYAFDALASYYVRKSSEK